MRFFSVPESIMCKLLNIGVTAKEFGDFLFELHKFKPKHRDSIINIINALYGSDSEKITLENKDAYELCNGLKDGTYELGSIYVEREGDDNTETERKTERKAERKTETTEKTEKTERKTKVTECTEIEDLSELIAQLREDIDSAEAAKSENPKATVSRQPRNFTETEEPVCKPKIHVFEGHTCEGESCEDLCCEDLCNECCECYECGEIKNVELTEEELRKALIMLQMAKLIFENYMSGSFLADELNSYMDYLIGHSVY